jgi:ribosomal protein L23
MKIVVKADLTREVNREALRPEIVRLLEAQFGVRVRSIKVKG